MIFDVTINRTGNFFLTLKESYYTPWEATVDGEKVLTEPTKRGLITIPITGGRHRVEFHFGRTKPEVWGLITSIATVAVLVILISRSNNEPKPPRIGRSRKKRPKRGLKTSNQN
jgi:uncharacterized membrane protein YfhO